MDSINIDMKHCEIPAHMRTYPDHSWNAYLIHLNKVYVALKAVLAIATSQNQMKLIRSNMVRITELTRDNMVWDNEKELIAVSLCFVLVYKNNKKILDRAKLALES